MANSRKLLGRRGAMLVVLAAVCAQGARAEPQMLRFRAATVTGAHLGDFERDYSRLLDYRVRERGRLSGELAASWAAPRMAGKRYLLMSSDAAPDVLLRAIESKPVAGYRPLTTYGWNAIEIVAEDTDRLRARFEGGPFNVVGEPAFLGGYPTIKAFQVRGRANEIVYLTAETGDRSRSPLPAPGGEVGRIFIMVVAGPDIHVLNDWYSTHFNLTPGAVRERNVGVLTRAQELPADRKLPITTVRLAQQGNLLELDGYSEKARPRTTLRGELPPGVALVSVAVRNLDAVKLDYLAPPRLRKGALYGARRSATVRGAAGELLELIEERD